MTVSPTAVSPIPKPTSAAPNNGKDPDHSDPSVPLPAAGGGSALLRFSEPEQAVDTVRFDSGAITLRYPYENVSGKAVTILEVHSTCGCFTGEVDTRSLRPGGKGVLVAVFDPKSLYGDQTRYLTVVTSDGTDNVLSSIAVKGYVLRDESEGKIRYAEDLGQGLRTDTSVNALAWDSFGDFAFSIPLYNDTDEEMTLEITAPRRVKLYAPATLPARRRASAASMTPGGSASGPRFRKH